MLIWLVVRILLTKSLSIDLTTSMSKMQSWEKIILSKSKRAKKEVRNMKILKKSREGFKKLKRRFNKTFRLEFHHLKISSSRQFPKWIKSNTLRWKRKKRKWLGYKHRYSVVTWLRSRYSCSTTPKRKVLMITNHSSCFRMCR